MQLPDVCDDSFCSDFKVSIFHPGRAPPDTLEGYLSVSGAIFVVDGDARRFETDTHTRKKRYERKWMAELRDALWLKVSEWCAARLPSFVAQRQPFCFVSPITVLRRFFMCLCFTCFLSVWLDLIVLPQEVRF